MTATSTTQSDPWTILRLLQWTTEHLEQFGAMEIPRDDYLRRLDAALRLDRRFA